MDAEQLADQMSYLRLYWRLKTLTLVARQWNMFSDFTANFYCWTIHFLQVVTQDIDFGRIIVFSRRPGFKFGKRFKAFFMLHIKLNQLIGYTYFSKNGWKNAGFVSKTLNCFLFQNIRIANFIKLT